MFVLFLICVSVLFLFANGAATAPFKTAKIIKNNVECVGIRSMTIEVDDAIAAAFTIPGAPPSSPIYLVILTLISHRTVRADEAR